MLLDVEGNRYADMDKIQPVNLQGKHVASRGPLPIPPSEQGQPVIFQAGGGSYGLELAGRYASGVYANPYTIEDARAQREALRDAAKRAGRDPDEVKMLAGFMPTVAPSREAALERRRFLDEVVDLHQRVRYLGAIIGLPLGTGQLDEPLTAQQLADAVPSPHDPRSARALKVARKGWTLRDVIAHGVIAYHPVVAGTAADVADHMQEWFEAGACDGFSIAMAAVPSPVAVVTARDGTRPHGTTVSAFASLSLTPPMVLVSLDNRSQLLALVRRTGRFGLNILGVDQAELATAFARSRPDSRRHRLVAERGPAPIAGLGGLGRRRGRRVRHGRDHTVLLAHVVTAEAGPGGPRLLTYHQRSFGTHPAGRLTTGRR